MAKNLGEAWGKDLELTKKELSSEDTESIKNYINNLETILKSVQEIIPGIKALENLIQSPKSKQARKPILKIDNSDLALLKQKELWDKLNLSIDSQLTQNSSAALHKMVNKGLSTNFVKNINDSAYLKTYYLKDPTALIADIKTLIVQLKLLIH